MNASPSPSWPELLHRLLTGAPLETQDAAWAMGQVLAGEATDAQVAGFVVALRAKGETAGEVAGLAEAMLAAASPLTLPAGLAAASLVDTCGTGGDRRRTVNVSTMAALVVAGAGLAVAKHGNRAASSACGSADLLEQLGVAVDLGPDGVSACLAEARLAFCFAAVFHPAMRHAAAVRGQLGVPTVFNILGPLTNPARPGAQVVGVADPRLAPVMAGVLASRGTSALVVHGTDGLDEFSVSAPSQVWVVRSGAVTAGQVDPQRLGLHAGDLTGGDAAHNAGVCRVLLAGAPGPVRDAVLLNAAAALVAAASAEGSTADGSTADGAAGAEATLEDELAAALPRAAQALDSGGAAEALQRWVATSQAAAALTAGRG